MVGDILQPTHLLFVLVVALLVLGPKRLPEVGRTLGNGIRDFRAAINGESTEKHEDSETLPWHKPDPEPEEKHEFAHNGPPAPESHEFAHEPEPASTPVEGQSSEPSHSPTAAGDDAAPAPEKHEFAFESSEAAENPAGPRT